MFLQDSSVGQHLVHTFVLIIFSSNGRTARFFIHLRGAVAGYGDSRAGENLRHDQFVSMPLEMNDCSAIGILQR